MKFFDFFRKKNSIVPEESNAVVLANGVALSPELSRFKTKIEDTALPFVRIKAKPSQQLTLTQSKFGGMPYWPATRPYPVDSESNYLFHLAQLNFSEIPPLEGYPEKGLLQFFISNNDIYGLNFDDPTAQIDFRVVYHEEVDEATAEKEFSFLKGASFDNVPLSKTMHLEFSKETDYVGSSDVRFFKHFGEEVLPFADRFGDKADAVCDELFENFPADGHKIGGYAYFTQSDPRDNQLEYEDWVLLLQIDSQDDAIIWGDVGVANFFIHPEALKRKDFSKILYNWDCT